MKFANSPGHEEVMAGNYELSNRKNSKHVLSGDGSVALLPGMSIVMAIIVDQVPLTDSTCPMPVCGSTDTVVVAEGGRKWYVRNTLRGEAKNNLHQSYL